MNDELNLRVNVVLAPDQNAEDFEPNFNIADYEIYGIYSTIKHMFTAPNKVMAYLCKSGYLHQIPVGDDRTDHKFDRLKDNSNFRRVYSRQSIYAINTSRYDGSKVVVQDSCPESRFLNLTVNETELKQLKRQIQDMDTKITQVKTKTREIDETLGELNAKQEELREQKKKLDDKKNEKRILEMKINELKEKICRNRGLAVDMDKCKRDCEASLNKYQDYFLQLIKDLSKMSKECAALNLIKNKARIGEEYAKMRLNSKQEKLSVASEQFEELKDSLKRSEDLLAELKREARDLRNRAKDRSGFDANDCSEEIRKQFDCLPNTCEDIDNSIGTLKLRINSIADADETVKEAYTLRRRNIERQQKDLESRKKEVALKMLKVSQLKEQWIPALEELIGKINDNFANFMDQIKCAGEVSLYKPEDQDNYEEYGISIKVKFRSTESLRELTSFHQSGGERSVSTMIYMIALQELTKVPFRCVDEINQVLV